MATSTTPDAGTLHGDYRCWKCSGAGRLTWTSIDNGRCWACKGTGRLKAGEFTQRDGVYTFVVSVTWDDARRGSTTAEVVWQFISIHHDDLDPGADYNGVHRTITSKATGIYRRVDSVLFQAFYSGSSRRRGKTLFRARVSPEAGRHAWRRAKAGVHPDQLTNAELGLPDAPACSWDRHRLGIEEL